MTKTTNALRIELEDQKNKIYELAKAINRERTRIDRIVQVLLNNLPQEKLNTVISFDGVDCCGNNRYWPKRKERTLKDFLAYIVDP